MNYFIDGGEGSFRRGLMSAISTYPNARHRRRGGVSFVGVGRADGTRRGGV